MPTFQYLPGTTVQVEDQGLQIARPATGPVILLLGQTTSTNVLASTNVPYSIGNSSITTADQIFRNVDGSVSELCQALYECQVAGGTNIVLNNILPAGSGAFTANNDVYGYLSAAYDILINYPADIVCPVGVQLDEAVTLNYGTYGVNHLTQSAGTVWNYGYPVSYTHLRAHE